MRSLTPSIAAPAVIGALVAAIAALLLCGAQPLLAQDEFTVTAEPTAGLEDDDVVVVTLAGTPAGEGVYVRQCIAGVGDQRPTTCNGTGVWATLPAGLPQTPDGSFGPAEGTIELPVAVTFGDVDCTAVQCGVFTRRDHNDGTDTTLDRWIPITFAAGAPGGARSVTRVEGPDRHATAAAAAETFTEATTAYVAVGHAFADALAAGPAAIGDSAPLLLVASDAVPATTRAALEQLAPERIVLLGGPGVISDRVETELSAIAPTTRRAGADRFATAAAVSAASWPDGATDVFVASGLTHADALGGGAGAGAYAAPLLLVAPDALPAPTRSELERLSPARITILGGEGSVSPAVQQALNEIAPTTRIAGTSRDDTAANVATTLWPAGTRTAVVVNGDGFADALSAAALAGLREAPVLLVTRDTVPSPTADALTTLGVTNVIVLGGPSAVSDAVLDALAAG